MSVYIVTGKLGNGKTLVTVGRIKDALLGHHRVATNLDINLKSMFGKDAKNIDLVRIPDKPNLFDLNSIGKGYEGDYNEDKFGSLILDECGTWFNSRNWQDKTRKEVNDWFLHARKLRWHVYIIIQDITMLDSQARDAIGELLVECKRLDKIRVPFIGAIFKLLFDKNLTLPRIHRAKVTYSGGILSDTWIYRGNDLFNCYQTDQMFIADYPHGAHSVLTPWHLYGRHKKPLTKERLMRITKIYWKRFSAPVLTALAFLLGASLMLFYNAYQLEGQLIKANYIEHQKSINQTTPTNGAKPVKPASEGNTEKTPEEKPQSKIAQFIDRLKIIGTYSFNDLRLYTFSTGEPDHYFTSSDIVGMGIAIKPLSDCMAEVTIESTTTLVRCL
jgi:hypothetical protein